MKQDDLKSKDDKSSSQQRLSKDLHETLSEIFKKVGSKEHTQEVSTELRQTLASSYFLAKLNLNVYPLCFF